MVYQLGQHNVSSEVLLMAKINKNGVSLINLGHTEVNQIIITPANVNVPNEITKRTIDSFFT